MTSTSHDKLSKHCSASAPAYSGVPHVSALGPMPFSMHIKSLSAIIDSYSITHHSSADDIQLLMSSSFRGENHEFCLVVNKFKHVRSCPSFDITYT